MVGIAATKTCSRPLTRSSGCQQIQTLINHWSKHNQNYSYIERSRKAGARYNFLSVGLVKPPILWVGRKQIQGWGLLWKEKKTEEELEEPQWVFFLTVLSRKKNANSNEEALPASNFDRWNEIEKKKLKIRWHAPISPLDFVAIFLCQSMYCLFLKTVVEIIKRFKFSFHQSPSAITSSYHIIDLRNRT